MFEETLNILRMGFHGISYHFTQPLVILGALVTAVILWKALKP